MKHVYQTLFLILLVPLWTNGQMQNTTTDTVTFTLEQCLTYGIENSNVLKNSFIDQEIAKSKVNETIGIGLPQIDGSVGITHNQQLSRFFTTYSSQGGFIPPDRIPAGVNEGDVIAAQNFFQLKSAGSAGLTINQILFNGSYIVGLQASKSYKELSEKSTGQTKEQLIADITKAYYLIITNQERIKLFDGNIQRIDSLLRSTRALNDNGFNERIDVERVQVTYNNLVASKINFVNLQLVAIEALKFAINYPMDQPLKVSGSLESLRVPDLSTYGTNWGYDQRWDYQILLTNRKLQEFEVKNKYAASVPSLNAFVNMGYTTQSPDIGGLFTKNTNISDNGIVGPDKWYGYSNYGVSLSVPIFSSLQRSNRVQQAKLNLLKLDNSKKTLESSINFEITRSRTNFDNALKTLQSQRENMVLAGDVARVTKIKYEQGVGSNIEVIDAENSLIQSQMNYYSSLYDALLSKVDIDKAYGKLNPIQQN